MDETTVEMSQRTLDELQRMRARITTETAANRRWLLSMLLALNLCALIWAAILRQEVTLSVSLRASSLFSIGALSALLASFAFYVLGTVRASFINEAISRWARVRLSELSVDNAMSVSASVRKVDLLRNWSTHILAILSSTLLASGILLLVLGVSNSSFAGRSAHIRQDNEGVAKAAALPKNSVAIVPGSNPAKSGDKLSTLPSPVKKESQVADNKAGSAGVMRVKRVDLNESTSSRKSIHDDGKGVNIPQAAVKPVVAEETEKVLEKDPELESGN